MKVYTIGIMSWWGCETRYRVKGHLLQVQIDGQPIEPRLILRMDDDTTVVIRKILKKNYKVYPDYYFEDPSEWRITEDQKKSLPGPTVEEAMVTAEPLPAKSTEAPIKSAKIFPEEGKPLGNLTEIISRISGTP